MYVTSYDSGTAWDLPGPRAGHLIKMAALAVVKSSVVGVLSLHSLSVIFEKSSSNVGIRGGREDEGVDVEILYK